MTRILGSNSYRAVSVVVEYKVSNRRKFLVLGLIGPGFGHSSSMPVGNAPTTYP